MKFLVLSFCLVGFFFSTASSSFAQPRGPSTSPVIAVKPTVGEISDSIEALGTLAANESVVLSSTVTETVAEVHFDDGQLVEKGTLLVLLRSAEEQALLEEVSARVSEAQRQYERVQPLKQGGAAPVSLIDERLREFQTAKAQFDAIEARLMERRILAPFTGVLGIRRISVGSLVTPGQRIVTIDDVSQMKLDFTVPSIFLPALTQGLSVKATAREFGERSFTGEIYSIDSRIDPVSRSIEVRAIIPNEERLLLPGLLMTVTVLSNPRRAITIPEEAIVTEGPDRFVFLVQGTEGQSKVLKRKVQTGTRFRGTVEIIEGLAADDLMVAHGTIQIQDGASVNVIATMAEGETLQEILDRTKQHRSELSSAVNDKVGGA